MYTGNVHVGGPADVRILGTIIVSKIAVGPYDNNAYLLRDPRTDAQVLIDAAAEPGVLLDLVGESGLAAVVTTHGHRDHWQALAEVVEVTGAITYAHPEDAVDLPVPTDILVENGSIIEVGALRLEVIHLVGHTPGSIALAFDDPEGPPHVFTGDCLFPGGVGNTGKDPERFQRLITDVSERLFDRFPDETWVYPGHGRDTTLGAERASLNEWRERGW